MGQIIVLSGVTAQAGANAPRITMSAADRVAMRMPYLKHAVSANELTPVTGEGLQGRCRVTGTKLITTGAGKANMALLNRAGHLGIGGSVLSSAMGLKLPEGSATASYTIVVAFNIGTSTGSIYTTSRQLLNGFGADDVLANQMLTASGSANSAEIYKSKMLSVGIGTLSPFAIVNMPPSLSWGVVAVDFNNDTGVVSLSLDGITWSSVQRVVGGNTIGGTGYVTIGMPTTTAGLTDNLVGDTFIFGESLRAKSSDSAIASLIAAMKADYGIAA